MCTAIVWWRKVCLTIVYMKGEFSEIRSHDFVIVSSRVKTIIRSLNLQLLLHLTKASFHTHKSKTHFHHYTIAVDIKMVMWCFGSLITFVGCETMFYVLFRIILWFSKKTVMILQNMVLVSIGCESMPRVMCTQLQ